MTKKVFLSMLMAVTLVLSIVIVAQARGAPQKQKAVQVAATVDVPVVTADVPTMQGYDVIQNLSEPRALISAQTNHSADLPATSRLSSPRPLCSKPPVELAAITRPKPEIVRRA